MLQIATKGVAKSSDRQRTSVPTIKQLQQRLWDQRHAGSNCPVCGRRVRLYDRALNQAQGVFLVRLVILYVTHSGFYHARDVQAVSVAGHRAPPLGGDYSHLVSWGLIEADPRRPKSGYYRPTAEGIAFVRGETEVPSHIRKGNSPLLVDAEGFLDKTVTISDVLGTAFNFSDLTAAADDTSPWKASKPNAWRRSKNNRTRPKLQIARRRRDVSDE